MKMGPGSTSPIGRREHGFTLMETLIAIIVMAAGLLVLAQLVGVAIHNNSKARSGSIAIEVAQGQLEMLRAQYYRELHTGVVEPDLSPTSAGSPHSAPPLQVGNRYFMVRWEVTQVAGNRKTVQVTAVEAIRTGGSGNDVTVYEDPLMRQTKRVTVVSHFAP